MLGHTGLSARHTAVHALGGDCNMTENNSYVLCGARIYDTDSESYVTGGIAVKNGVITELGTLSEESSAAAEDVGGARIIPAMVDVHTRKMRL